MPLLPEVGLSQEALLPTVQVHPEDVVTFRLPDPPDALKDWLVGERE